MLTRILIAGAAMAAAMSLAQADDVTGKIKLWDPAAKTLVLDSGEKFPIDPATTEMPADLKPGDTVYIDYSSTEDGVTAVFSVKKEG